MAANESSRRLFLKRGVTAFNVLAALALRLGDDLGDYIERPRRI
jgi:hypothetical protein